MPDHITAHTVNLPPSGPIIQFRALPANAMAHLPTVHPHLAGFALACLQRLSVRLSSPQACTICHSLFTRTHNPNTEAPLHHTETSMYEVEETMPCIQLLLMLRYKDYQLCVENCQYMAVASIQALIRITEFPNCIPIITTLLNRHSQHFESPCQTVHKNQDTDTGDLNNWIENCVLISTSLKKTIYTLSNSQTMSLQSL